MKLNINYVMNKLLLIVMMIGLPICMFSQTISVSSFKLLDSDLTANTAGTIEKDQNGETAALIKMVTTQTGFSFDGGSMGIVKTKQTPGEVWVYVPRGSKKITIKHPQLGVLRDYYYPISIEAARTYEMVLTTGVVQTIVQQAANSQYLVFKVTPSDAVVELDNEPLPITDGVAQKFVKLGTYNYRVQAANYHTAAGKVTVDDPNNKKILEVNLQPAYGWIEILGNDDNNGAQVFIDNALVGTIPMKSTNLSSGEHHIKIVKSLYNPYSQSVVVNDNQTTQITPQLNEDFSVVTIRVENDADIYINEEKKGSGSWTGKLATGSYLLEAKKEGHHSTLINAEVSAEHKNQTIQLTAPMPIYGSLNITSTPSESDVYIDGQKIGQTPIFLPEILSGTRQIEVIHTGYDNYKSTIVISEKENSSLNAILIKDKRNLKTKNLVKVDITCNVPHAILYVDGERYGKVSDDIFLRSGSHKIKLNADGYKDVETLLYVYNADRNLYRITMQSIK